MCAALGHATSTQRSVDVRWKGKPEPTRRADQSTNVIEVFSSTRLSKISYGFNGKRSSLGLHSTLNTPSSQQMYGVTFALSQRGKEHAVVDGYVFDSKDNGRRRFCCKTSGCRVTLVQNRDKSGMFYEGQLNTGIAHASIRFRCNIGCDATNCRNKTARCNHTVNRNGSSHVPSDDEKTEFRFPIRPLDSQRTLRTKDGIRRRL